MLETGDGVPVNQANSISISSSHIDINEEYILLLHTYKKCNPVFASTPIEAANKSTSRFNHATLRAGCVKGRIGAGISNETESTSFQFNGLKQGISYRTFNGKICLLYILPCPPVETEGVFFRLSDQCRG